MESQNHEGATGAQTGRPDFVADEYGHVQDVRAQAHSSASTPSQGTERPFDPPRPMGRAEPASPEAQIRHRYYIIPIPIGLVITLIVLLMSNTGPRRAAKLYSEGLDYFQQSQYALAIGKLTEAIRVKPDYGLAYDLRGLSYQGLDNFEAATNDSDKAVELLPNAAQVYNNRGIAYQQLGDYKNAIADFDRAVELDAGLAKAWYNGGSTRLAIDDYEGAIADFDQAIERTDHSLYQAQTQLSTGEHSLLIDVDSPRFHGCSLRRKST